VAEAKEAKQDLRKSHFAFGNEKDGFVTTNMDRFRNSSGVLGSDTRVTIDNRDRKGVNIVYGTEKP
jgi:hypothetical protein